MVGNPKTVRESEDRKIFESIGSYTVAFENLIYEVREGCL